MDQIETMRADLAAAGVKADKRWGTDRLADELRKIRTPDVNIVAASEPEPVVAHRVALPAYMEHSELCLRETAVVPADVRAALMGLLCCRIEVTNGVLSAADGRGYRLRRVGQALELIE